MAVHDLLLAHLDTTPDAPALTSRDVTVSYQELVAQCDATAAGLIARGVRPGQPVALQQANGIGFVTSFLGVLRAGAVAVPIPVYATARDRAELLHRTGAKLCLDEEAAEQLRRTAVPAVITWPSVDESQLAVLPQSSGTTGVPKIVELTHANIVANSRQFAAAVPIAAADTVLSTLPLSHIYGLTATLLAPLTRGAHVVTQPFEATSFLAAHARHGIGVTFIAPPIAPLLAHAPDSVTFPQLHHIISGAAALPAASGHAVEARTGAAVLQGYGMTEASPVTHLRRLSSSPMESIGTPLNDTEHAIVDPDSGVPLPAGAVGELVVRGPQVMRGYHLDPQATGEVLRGGWLHTGDLARILPDGSVVLAGRIKDIITSHGVQVSPTKVEHRLLEHPGVVDVAVFRGRTTRGEEAPAAAIVGTATTAELTRFAREHLNPYERPRIFLPVDAIPRSAAGKILRRELEGLLD
ncbi:class I adenylate-forming enzyme family protein [Corynebacterium sp. 13CS0277]|uniref:class I adenylate-forming enzyme family protein n=1 Tax=Corynebacterium sp. 13CS0277 TaxID=2071994 RepID=UPI001304A503|nr:AMP-binding protein [Corynebacterium sp. 13CS0277]